MVTPLALSLDAVSFAYAAAPILSNVTLRLQRGEMVAMLGPNGAGKSTLLRLAAGALTPRHGSVSISGRPIAAHSRRDLARAVAVLPQDFTIQFAYTARQVVELGRTPHLGPWSAPSSADRAAVERALAATGADALAHRVFNELSGGERQRVLVALAVAQESALILLDEPTAHLDVRHQTEILELLHALNHERGVTILAAMHDLNLAARYFPRLVLLDGTLVADGDPASVLTPGHLKRAYGAELIVGVVPGDRHLTVVPSLPRVPGVEPGAR